MDLVRLNEFLGGYYFGYVCERWSKLKAKEVERFLAKTGDVAVGNLLSLHGNGYIRHIAVKFLAGIESGEVIRFLLIRQNDWVDQIAMCAQAAICDRLNDENLDRFAVESDLLMHLLRCKRQDQSKTVSTRRACVRPVRVPQGLAERIEFRRQKLPRKRDLKS